jgi:hypothetical protein
MSSRVYSVFMLSCVGSCLETCRSPVQGYMPTVYKSKKLKEAARAQTGLWSH